MEERDKAADRCRTLAYLHYYIKQINEINKINEYKKIKMNDRPDNIFTNDSFGGKRLILWKQPVVKRLAGNDTKGSIIIHKYNK